MLRLELSDSDSNKFWQAARSGREVVVRFGRIGTDGRETRKEYDSEEGAEVAMQKLIHEKKRKGYVETGAPVSSARAAHDEVPARPEPLPPNVSNEAAAFFTESPPLPRGRTYEEERARELELAPFRRRFNECGDLDALEQLVQREIDSGAVSSAPWLNWIFEGPPRATGEAFMLWNGDKSGSNADAHPQKQARLRAVIEKLLEAGVPVHDGNNHALVQGLFYCRELSDAHKRAVLAFAVEKGIDMAQRVLDQSTGRPGRSVLDAALFADVLNRKAGAAGSPFLEAVSQRVTAEDLARAHHHVALELLKYRTDEANVRYRDVLAGMGDPNRIEAEVSWTGGSEGGVLHFALDPERTETELPKLLPLVDVNLPLQGNLTLEMPIRGHRWKLRFTAGSTALDIVEGMLRHLDRTEAANCEAKYDGFTAGSLKSTRRACKRNRDLLVAHGARHGTPSLPDLPIELGSLAAQLERLASALGHDTTALREEVARVAPQDIGGAEGAWQMLRHLTVLFAPQLLSPRFDAYPLLGHTLGAFLKRHVGNVEVAHFIGEEWQNEFKTGKLPKDLRGGVIASYVFHKDEAGSYLMVKNTRLELEVWRANGAEVETLAASVGEFLEQLIDRWMEAENPALKRTSAPAPSKAKPSTPPPEETAPRVSVRPFAHVREAFMAAYPNAQEHGDLPSPWSFLTSERIRVCVDGDFHTWAARPPLPALYLMEGAGAKAALGKAAAPFVRESNFGNVLGTWGTRGKVYHARIDGGGFISTVHLTHPSIRDNQSIGPGDLVNFVLAVWRVEEGVTVAILPVDAKDIAMKLLGLSKWPSEWNSTRTEYGRH